jgi:hypothetical protein
MLAFLGFVGMIAGCHTAGACDCAGPGNACCYGNVGMGLAPTQWSPIAMSEAGEPARAMPKAERELDAGKAERIGPPIDTGK